MAYYRSYRPRNAQQEATPLAFNEVEVVATIDLWQTERSTGVLQIALGSWDGSEKGRLGVDVRQWVYSESTGRWKADKGFFQADEKVLADLSGFIQEAAEKLKATKWQQKTSSGPRRAPQKAEPAPAKATVRKRQPSTAAQNLRNNKRTSR